MSPKEQTSSDPTEGVPFILRLTGARPLLVHNGRLANPLDPYVRSMKEYTGKRRKTDEDYRQMLYIEARGGVYEADENPDLLGMPDVNVWRSLFDAAKAFKRGMDIKRALICEMRTPPLLVDGAEAKIEEFLAAGPEHIDYRPVRIGTSKSMRARALIEHWSSTHEFILLTDVIDPRDMIPIVERAGRLVGLGDWRPMFGAFTAEILS
jgi:hypothetical protein